MSSTSDRPVTETVWAAREVVGDLAARLRGLADEGSSGEPLSVSAGDAMTALAELEELQNRVDAVRLALVGRLDEGLLMGAGWGSVEDFLSGLAGGRRGYGRAITRLAERLEWLPAVGDAHAAGELRTAKAEVIAAQTAKLRRDSGLRAQAGEALLERARTLDAVDLARALPGVMREIDPAGDVMDLERSLAREERGAHLARYLAFTPDRFGGVKVEGYGTPEDVETIKTALIPLSAPEPVEPCGCGGERPRPGEPTLCTAPDCPGDGRDRREYGTRLWDGLVEACRRLVTVRLAPRTHQAPPRLTVTMTLADLVDGLSGRLPDATVLSVGAVRQLACDAELIPAVLGSASQVLDVGRAERLVTPAIWNALVTRDEHCAFPGCHRLPVMCQADHIVHWADGGPTSLDNLVLLCRRHHTITHHTPWRVDIDPDSRRPVWRPPPPQPVEELAQRMSWRLADGSGYINGVAIPARSAEKPCQEPVPA